jgi:hypothetical protein
MQAIELLYVVFSVTLSAAGLAMVVMAMRAYRRTSRRAMLHLSIGFTLIVAAAIATTASAFMSDFENSRRLLTVNYLITTTGYVFVIYSITAVD